MIQESGLSSDTDRLEIRGYAAEEVGFARRGRDGEDLIIRLPDADDEITVVRGLLSFASVRIEEVHFRRYRRDPDHGSGSIEGRLDSLRPAPPKMDDILLGFPRGRPSGGAGRRRPVCSAAQG